MTDASGTPPMPGIPAPQTGDRVIYIQAPPPPAPRRGVLRSILVYVVAALVVFSLLLNFIMLSLMAMLGGGPGDDLREKYVSGSFTDEHKVVIVNISGLIAEGSGGLLNDDGNMENVVQQLRKARLDKKVVGIVLEINSPGGSVTASDIILHEVERAKKEGKKIVVWMGSLAASGGYYVSCKADKIYASPTTITGSIGVIMDLFNVQGLSDKVGFKMQIIKCGKFKDMGSPFRDMDDAEREKFQAIADSAFDRFKHVVAEGRNLRLEDMDRIADGSVLTAQQALGFGLVDKIDYFEAAVEEAKAGFAKAAVVRYRRPSGLLSALLSSKASGQINVHIDTPLPNLQPGMYYLWMPGLPAKP